jgi:hypothetical protein
VALTLTMEGSVPPKQQEKAMDTIESVNEAALDLVVGGLRDNPDQDAANQRRAAQNSKDGTLGGSIGNAIPGIVTDGSGPNTPGHPVEYP